MKNTVIISIAVLVVVGAFGFSVYQYQHRPTVAPNSVSTSKYNQAVQAVVLHDAVNAKALSDEQGQVKTLTAQKAAICAAAKPKVVIALCN